ncbi:L-seryl-tRNA(Sec) selenium transferase [Shewanella sp. NFH-SH190041]|uniref:L-seryl-tRNA(Sec) selenium transferase n=1 Tax=Shewanella sp. NFH-SH190041 TaxID=2950245 RepID=UPI0021C304A9|nr:L-seryl-tRNA(Sec) selenium transferase [Shewanella sp. NFH-SH190041]BDM63214.1 L-seryl-tRNA(Sec) selenium transferase [Shewanella sp. NFH-SH190041]
MTQAIDSSRALFRLLPAMDSLLKISQVMSFTHCYGRSVVKTCLAAMLAQARQQIAHGGSLPDWCLDQAVLLSALEQQLQLQSRHSMTPVMNLSGTVLHTNLGRSQLSEAAIAAVTDVMRYPVPLEFDMGAGKRGHRDSRISELVHELTGAQACCVVNNNAAAVLLMLAAVAPGKEVIVSRGELVEIGGAFRIPDIMAQAGCKLVEVGCTNRTHLKDYAAAITDNTAAIMKVHTSNYHISGFTAAVSEAELAGLCQAQGVALISDLGSGALTDLARFGLDSEPMPQQMLNAGVDLVSFSGDKLLGGPQAGLVVGQQALIDKLQSHPLKRALRCDKMTLAALEATLLAYRNPETLDNELPMLRKLARPLPELTVLGQSLLAFAPRLAKLGVTLQLAACDTQVGSGSQPHLLLPSVALTFAPAGRLSLGMLEQIFKTLPRPVIGRIYANRLWLDLRGCEDDTALGIALEQLLTRLTAYQASQPQDTAGGERQEVSA